ncbi:MAG: hypothetical protein AAB724_03435 [Patescibacteria group bacterium]
MLSPLQQSLDLIQKNNRLLIVLPENLNGDNLGAGLALTQALRSLNKKVDLVSAGEVPEKLAFLPFSADLKNKLTVWRDFIISIDTSQNKISRLRYETESNCLKIFLTTPASIREKDFHLEPGPYFYDLIITLDTPDLEGLGAIFSENAELFFSRPILNIDHRAANESFGEVNLIEPVAAACAEIIIPLLARLNITHSEQIATLFLTGLIAKTNSFQNSLTTPRALSLAGDLISQGANQEIIIQNLFKTKPLNSLRLWGRLLGQMEFDPAIGAAWLTAQPEDFVATNTSTQNLPFALEEIFEMLPKLNLAAIFWPDENHLTNALIQSRQPAILQKINVTLAGAIKNNRLLVKAGPMELSRLKEEIIALLKSVA